MSAFTTQLEKNPSSYIIAGVRLVDPAAGVDAPSELWIENGKVKEVAAKGSWTGAKARAGSALPEIIDAGGLTCVPGLIDLHTHLREPGAEYKETIATGTLAAAAGGYTAVLCMANTKPVNDNPYVTQFIMSQAAAHASVRVYPVGALSVGLKGEQLAEIGKMRDAGIVAVSDDGHPVMNSYLMRKALDYCKTFNLPVLVHAEDSYLVGKGVMHEGCHSTMLGLRGIPAESEEIIVARDIALARLTGGRVHFCHISTRHALDHIRRAKQEGLHVTAEVTPHHLCFTDEDVSEYDSNFKMQPPLRAGEDREALRQALAEGLIDCIATDHAPHAPRDKDVLFEFASNGVVGLETSWSIGLELVEAGTLSLNRLVEVLSTAPAKIAGIPGGTLRAGHPADFMLSELGQAHELTAGDLHSKSRNSPFLGRKLKGRVVATVVEGRARWLAE